MSEHNASRVFLSLTHGSNGGFFTVNAVSIALARPYFGKKKTIGWLLFDLMNRPA